MQLAYVVSMLIAGLTGGLRISFFRAFLGDSMVGRYGVTGGFQLNELIWFVRLNECLGSEVC